MTCIHCNGEHPDGFKFCPVTGKEIVQPFKACTNPECVDFEKRILPPDALFCPRCGEMINIKRLSDNNNENSVIRIIDAISNAYGIVLGNTRVGEINNGYLDYLEFDFVRFAPYNNTTCFYGSTESGYFSAVDLEPNDAVLDTLGLKAGSNVQDIENVIGQYRFSVQDIDNFKEIDETADNVVVALSSDHQFRFVFFVQELNGLYRISIEHSLDKQSFPYTDVYRRKVNYYWAWETWHTKSHDDIYCPRCGSRDVWNQMGDENRHACMDCDTMWEGDANTWYADSVLIEELFPIHGITLGQTKPEDAEGLFDDEDIDYDNDGSVWIGVEDGGRFYKHSDSYYFDCYSIKFGEPLPYELLRFGLYWERQYDDYLDFFESMNFEVFDDTSISGKTRYLTAVAPDYSVRFKLTFGSWFSIERLSIDQLSEICIEVISCSNRIRKDAENKRFHN
ncbi:MAG: zinc ribbon domain-containing protein [Bacteroidales bacterium]|nr:zinc ribbon domain-containing protein [Bacteroidales bacterium]